MGYLIDTCAIAELGNRARRLRSRPGSKPLLPRACS